MRALTIVVGLACVVSCTDAGTVVDGPASQSDGVPNASITIPVIGDPSSAPDSFYVTLDGFWWRQFKVGVTENSVVPSGNHKLAVSVNPGMEPSWCDVQPMKSYSARFSRNHLEVVTLPISCPPIVGSGQARFVVTVSGLPPAQIQVTVSRLNGSPVVDSFAVDVHSVTVRTIPVGLYKLTVTTSHCSANGTSLTSNRIEYVLHANAVIEVPVSVYCGPITIFKLPPGVP
jgi:hypothetical protein